VVFNSNATALLLKIACLPQAGIEKFEIVAFSIRFIKKAVAFFNKILEQTIFVSIFHWTE
jgi:hypothetical protein